MRTDSTPPILISSPDPNRAPATLMSIFSPSGRDSLIKLRRRQRQNFTDGKTALAQLGLERQGQLTVVRDLFIQCHRSFPNVSSRCYCLIASST